MQIRGHSQNNYHISQGTNSLGKSGLVEKIYLYLRSRIHFEGPDNCKNNFIKIQKCYIHKYGLRRSVSPSATAQSEVCSMQRYVNCWKETSPQDHRDSMQAVWRERSERSRSRQQNLSKTGAAHPRHPEK